MSGQMAHFFDPSSVARYAEGPPRLVPGPAALHRMTLLLLAERAPSDARVLVLGAGGGMELKVFAEGQPGWRFDGVEPGRRDGGGRRGGAIGFRDGHHRPGTGAGRSTRTADSDHVQPYHTIRAVLAISRMLKKR